MVDEHNKQDDSLERELAETFRPAPMSLELRERLGAELTHRRPMTRRRAPLGAIAAVAACFVIGIVLVRRDDDVAVNPPVQPTPVVDNVSSSSPPTVLDYQRAFAKSSESLEALLDRPAGGGVRLDDSAGEPARAFSRSFNGESL